MATYPVFHSLIFEQMFFPIFLAILLGLVTPSDTNTPPTGSGTAVSVNSDGTDPGSAGADTGGETSQIPPKKP